MTHAVLSFDIGSTYTKGALFDLVPGKPRLVKRDAVPTTTACLSDGIDELLNRLTRTPDETAVGSADAPLYVCSSAKGGLSIAALGIVPELTLHAARLAAASAGGKIVAHYCYYLTRDQAGELERMQPDIVLFCGGTDGGNEQYNLRNARMLAETDIASTILYAGNIAARDGVAAILANKKFLVTENIMPEVGRLQIELARACIQEVFLQRIVEGKGLSGVMSRCATELKPTPRAVFDLLEALSKVDNRWNDSIWFDLGGATTDCYSCTESFRGEESVVLRGLHEPKLKRTVEGDLGMRCNAPTVLETAAEYLQRELDRQNIPFERMTDFAARLAETRDYAPADAEGQCFDDLLARACIYHALVRHAGTMEESFTADGKIYVQRGKDLRGAKKWIGSGGYLSRLRSAEMYRAVLAAVRRDSGGLRLIPQSDEFYRDTDYLLPLLGNLAGDYPVAVAQLAMKHLEPMT